MRSFRLLIALIVSGTMAVPIPAAASPTSYVPGEILVKFKPGTPDETIERFADRMKTTVKRKSDLTGVQRLSLPADLSVEEALSAYQNHPDVLYAEPNYIRRASATIPNDSFLNEQWGLHNTGQTVNANPPFSGIAGADIGAPKAWDITTGSSQIIVAVIDSGVDYTHPDLSANVLTNGWNFVGTQTCTLDASNNCNCTADDLNGNSDPMDDNGHGTHVAGIMGAEGNNSIGIAGVLWTAQILPLKILGANGCGSAGDEIQAIDYAINKGAKIINASFGGPDLSSSEEDAIRAANTAGIVFVAAAGNESSDNDKVPIYPAGYNLPNVISVAASDPDDQLAAFSNFGKNRVDIAAPGVCILSTISSQVASELSRSCPNSAPAGYDYLSGSSMATPFVSGAAGLLLSQKPSLTPEEVRAIILSTADPKEGLKGRVASAGRLNAFNALRGIKGSGLIGGSGGCGFPMGMIRTSDRESSPPIQNLLFLLGIFWPLLIPLIRKHRCHRRTLRILANRQSVAAASGLLILVIFWPSTAAAVEEVSSFQPVHSLGLKIGYHRYDKSEYLDTNSGLVSRGDLAGLSEELEYEWRWREDAGLSVTAGRYHSRTDLKNVCCNSLEFSTNYLLITPKHYSSIQEWMEWYIGGGIGYYNFSREIHGLLEDRLSANVLGIHAVIGLDWPVLPWISVFTETRYALAKVKSADHFNDALDVGGLNYSFGLRWRFSPAGLRKSTAY
ncbi:MAG: S8 family serine peptidase [Nitrospirae bacterium]|nr:S8 family serine peptidase [Nitrospirota bacterium]